MEQYIRSSERKVLTTKNAELLYTLSQGNIGGYAPPKQKEKDMASRKQECPHTRQPKGIPRLIVKGDPMMTAVYQMQRIIDQMPFHEDKRPMENLVQEDEIDRASMGVTILTMIQTTDRVWG